MKNELLCLVLICRFSQTLPSRPGRSNSRNVHVNIYMFAFHVIYFKASHWPSGQMISSRALIGQPSTLPNTPSPSQVLSIAFNCTKPGPQS